MCTQNLICCCCAGAVVLLLGAFASFDDGLTAQLLQTQPPATVELLLTDDDSQIGEQGQHLISTQDEWQALWARHVGPDAMDPESGEVTPAPEIDFDTQLIAAVFIGAGRTSFGLTLMSFTSEDETLTIRYRSRSYQTAQGGRFHPDPVDAKKDFEQRYGHIRPYGFFVLTRSPREIVLLQDTRGMAQPDPKWTERARWQPPAR